MEHASPTLPGRPYPPPPGPESFWPVQVTLVVAIGLQIGLPKRLTVGPTWLVPALEGILIIGLSLATPRQLEHEHTARRRTAIALTAFVSAANVYALAALAHALLHNKFRATAMSWSSRAC